MTMRGISDRTCFGESLQAGSRTLLGLPAHAEQAESGSAQKVCVCRCGFRPPCLPTRNEHMCDPVFTRLELFVMVPLLSGRVPFRPRVSSRLSVSRSRRRLCVGFASGVVLLGVSSSH